MKIEISDNLAMVLIIGLFLVFILCAYTLTPHENNELKGNIYYDLWINETQLIVQSKDNVFLDTPGYTVGWTTKNQLCQRYANLPHGDLNYEIATREFDGKVYQWVRIYDDCS